MTTPDTKSSHCREKENFLTRGAHLNAPRAWVHPEDEVESSLHQAQELIRQAMSRRQHDSRHIQILPGGETAFHTAMDEMITKAEREILCALSPRDLSADRRNHAVRLLQAARHRGIPVKAVVPSPVNAARLHPVRPTGNQPGHRTRDLPDQDLVITDGREAVLRTPHREDESPQTVLVSMNPLVQVLRTMFAATWSSGAPLPGAVQCHEKLRGEPLKSILASLVAGEKDEVAARKLGISVRTYRRHVADIMREIRASSRFQAGARAAELGII
ncbi:TrmB family transcriptional regulator sugar-binding domain-containing protein [Micromonospora sp. NPDC048898]|uniref:TrmB family transcriptional regulator sugar-binding domain-containing protein n=1 Tax=Micromonospora sp. NPDC048898 TaxID=3364260 RepID=UPI003710C038